MEHILYDHKKPFDKFIEQFQELKAMAEVQDQDCVVRYFLKALPEELGDNIKFYLKMNHPDKRTITLDIVIEKTVAMYEALFRKKWQRQASLSNYSRGFSGHCENGSYSKQNTGGKRHYDSDKGPRSNDKNAKAVCQYHPGLTGHTTNDCLLNDNDNDKKKTDKIFKKYGTNANFCFTCKAPNLKKGEHVCPGTTETTAIKKRKIEEKLVPMAIDTTGGDTDSDEDIKDSYMTFSALATILTTRKTTVSLLTYLTFPNNRLT